MQLRDDGLNRSAIVTYSSKRSALCFWRAQESKTSKGYRQFEGETALVFKWNLSRRSSDSVSKMTPVRINALGKVRRRARRILQ